MLMIILRQVFETLVENMKLYDSSEAEDDKIDDVLVIGIDFGTTFALL